MTIWKPAQHIPILLVVLLTVVTGTDFVHAQEKPQLRSFADVQKLVDMYFANLENYGDGDLLTRKKVEPLFHRLAKAGWKVAERDEILSRILSDESFIAKELDSRQGKSFYRKISSIANGMDQLERMSQLPNGKKNLHRLIYEIPNGSDFVKAVATSQGGAYIGQSLSNSKQGKNLKKPTGRIYTVDALVAELKKSYDQKPRKEKQPAGGGRGGSRKGPAFITSSFVN